MIKLKDILTEALDKNAIMDIVKKVYPKIVASLPRAKKGTPKAHIKALEAAAKKYAESSEFKAASKKIGFTINYLNAKQFSKKIAKDDKKIKKLMNNLGLSKK